MQTAFVVESRETDPDRLNQDMVDSVLDHHLNGRYLAAFCANRNGNNLLLCNILIVTKTVFVSVCFVC